MKTKFRKSFGIFILLACIFFLNKIHAMEAEYNEVKIQLENGDISIPLNIANQSETLKYILQRQNEEENKYEIKLEHISLEIFSKIIELIEITTTEMLFHQKSQQIKELLDPLFSNFSLFKKLLLNLRYLDLTNIIKIIIINYRQELSKIDDPEIREFTEFYNQDSENELSKKRKNEEELDERETKRLRTESQSVEPIDFFKILKDKLQNNEHNRQILCGDKLVNYPQIPTQEEIEINTKLQFLQTTLRSFNNNRSHFQSENKTDSLLDLALKNLIKNLDQDPQEFIKSIATYPSEIIKLIFNKSESFVNKQLKGDKKGSTYLHLANSPNKVANLITLGANRNQKDIDGKTPIMRMLERGNLNAVCAIIDIDSYSPSFYRPDLKHQILFSTDNLGNYPIHYAAIFGHLDLVRDWISKYPSLGHIKNDNQETQLFLTLKYHAASHNKNFLAKLNPNIKDKNGKTILMHAILDFWDEKIIDYLIDKSDLEANTVSDETPLILAIRCGNQHAINALLRKNFNLINTVSRSGVKAIHCAILFDNLDALKIFIGLNIDPNTRFSVSNNTLLAGSIISGNILITKYLLSIPKIDVNLKNNLEETALMLAIKYNRIEIVKILLERSDIDFSLKNNSGETALFFACKSGNEEIMKLLLNKKNDFNIQDNKGNTVLINSVRDARLNIAKLLLERPEININLKNFEGHNALLFAATNIDMTLGNLNTVIAIKQNNKHRREILRILLNRKEINVNVCDKYGNSAFSHLMEDHEEEEIHELLELFINRGLDLNHETNRDILETASFYLDTKLVTILLEKNAKGNIANAMRNALFGQCCEYSEDIFKILATQEDININEYIKVTLADDVERILTPFMFASCLCERTSAIKILLDRKVDVNLQESYGIGNTALMLAIMNPDESEDNDDRQAIIETLVSLNNLDVNIQNQYGETALILAVKRVKELAEEAKHWQIDFFSIVNILLGRSDINLNLQDDKRNTALIYAIELQNYQLVEKLLTKPNLNLDLKNNDGKTAYTIANELNCQKIQNLLLNYKAMIS